MQANRNVSQGALLILILVITFALIWGLLSEAASRSNPRLTATALPTRSASATPEEAAPTLTLTLALSETPSESLPVVMAETADGSEAHPVLLTARAFETQFPLPPTRTPPPTSTPTLTPDASATPETSAMPETLPTGQVGENDPALLVTDDAALPGAKGDHPVILTARAFETQFPLPPTNTPPPTPVPTEEAAPTLTPTVSSPFDFNAPEPTPADLVAVPLLIAQTDAEGAVVYRLAAVDGEGNAGALVRAALVIKARLVHVDDAIVGLSLAEGDAPATIDVIVSGEHDSEALIDLITRQGLFEFVDFSGVADLDSYTGAFILTTANEALLADAVDFLLNPVTNAPFETVLSGDIFEEAAAQQGSLTGTWQVFVRFTEEAAATLSEYTAAHLEEPMALVLEGEVLLIPILQAAFGDAAVITGDFSRAEVESIAAALSGGVLPLPLELYEVRVIQPAQDA